MYLIVHLNCVHNLPDILFRTNHPLVINDGCDLRFVQGIPFDFQRSFDCFDAISFPKFRRGAV